MSGQNDNINSSSVEEFILVGFSHLQDFYTVLFIIFFCIYLTVIFGNCTILVAVLTNEKLQTPMYFFLCNLSITDMLFTTTTVPKMLALFAANSNAISFSLCFTQLCFWHSFGCSEAFLLVVMAYDRYVAVCQPLYYRRIMTNNVNILLVASTWILPFVILLPGVILASKLPFCGPNQIYNCFCEHFAVIRLACSDITFHVFLGFSIAMTVSFMPLILVVLSYIKILTTIFQIGSTEERLKAFSKCSSHIMAVFTYYTSIIIAYVSYTVEISDSLHVVATICITILAPSLNPLIYTLRNKEVKDTITKLLYQNVENQNNFPPFD
ncbi:olfactory receptor 2AT4-like [Protopterus annectens]|uniref:olfactory receptor 2AT4-like n=1 Tax=Protopterus annectens TaxID=7888 RepID=UPI001CFA70E5|nr:olfactory receptor 2AT4-like [Protopterus annectens]